MNWLERIFAYIGGAYLPTLENTPSDTSKYVTIGVFVFNTALLAFVTMSFAMSSIFLDTPTASWLVAGVWALIIFGIDWGLVKTMKKQQYISWLNLSTYTQIVIPTILRIGVATLISFTISKPLEVKIFEGKLSSKIEEMKAVHVTKKINERDSINKINTTLEDIQGNIKDLEDERETVPESVKDQRDKVKGHQNKVRELEDKRDSLIRKKNALWQTHAYKFCAKKDSLGNCLRYRWTCTNSSYIDIKENKIPNNKAEIKKYKKLEESAQQLETQITIKYRADKDSSLKIEREREKTRLAEELRMAEYRKRQDSILRVEAENAYNPRYLISQIEALEELSAEPNNESIFWTKWLIFAVIWLLDLMPVFIKILSPFGPYEQAMLDVERDKQYESRLRNKLMREEYRNNQSMIRSLARRQKQYIMDAVKTQFNEKREGARNRRKEE